MHWKLREHAVYLCGCHTSQMCIAAFPVASKCIQIQFTDIQFDIKRKMNERENVWKLVNPSPLGQQYLSLAIMVKVLLVSIY